MLIPLLKFVNNYFYNIFYIFVLKGLRIGSACVRKYSRVKILSLDESIA
jgi:hypothetical protein